MAGFHNTKTTDKGKAQAPLQVQNGVHCCCHGRYVPSGRTIHGLQCLVSERESTKVPINKVFSCGKLGTLDASTWTIPRASTNRFIVPALARGWVGGQKLINSDLVTCSCWKVGARGTDGRMEGKTSWWRNTSPVHCTSELPRFESLSLSRHSPWLQDGRGLVVTRMGDKRWGGDVPGSMRGMCGVVNSNSTSTKC